MFYHVVSAVAGISENIAALNILELGLLRIAHLKIRDLDSH